MAHAAVVGINTELGSRMVKLLQQAGVRINVAMWLLTGEYEDWRFVLASTALDKLPPFDQYATVDAVLRKHIPVARRPPLLILKMSDPFIRGLRRQFAHAQNVEGMQLGNQLIGQRFVENAYVYSIS